MGLKGFTCPPHGEEPGRNNKIEYCVNECSCPCVAPNVLSAIFSEEKKNPHKGNIVSVTMLTGGCKRKTYLERNEPYYVTPDKKLPTFRGTLIHSVVEKSSTKVMKKAGWQLETNMKLPCKTKSGEWILSGTLDAYDPVRKTIFDIKTLQEYAVEKMVKGKEEGMFSKHIPDQYVKQLNMYRYMASKLGLFEADRLRLQIVAFGRLILTGTTVVLKVREKGEYVEREFDLPDVPILKDEYLEQLIATEGDEWFRILYANEAAPVCSAEWAWLCKSCVFNGTKHCPDPELERNGNWI